MPNSDLFLVKENPEDVSIKLTFQNHFHEIVPNCSQSPTSSDSVLTESPTRQQNPISSLNQSQISLTNNSRSHSPAQKGEIKEEEEEGAAGPLLSKENCKLMIEEHGEEEEDDDDDDGFRTPTSLDHRIPEDKQCPPAPRKPKPSLKRKAPLTQTSAPLLYDPKEVQLLFPIQHNLISRWHRNTKKVRRDEPK